LLALGCHDWRLERLVEFIDSFFVELPSLLSGARNPLTQAEQQALQAAILRLKTFCRELMQLGIPATLHHGDFQRGNIIVNDAACTLLDWSGFVGVTHPFLSLWLPLNDWSQDLHTELLEGYLEVWSDIAPREQLHAAVMKANPLAELCGALGHRYQIAHAQNALSWDILGEQEHILECLRNVLTLVKK
jgi:aminoglycoside phosphotransferase (APT) family kinase protein